MIWINQPKYSKANNFAPVCVIINLDFSWCQKLPTNQWMTLGFIYNHIFKKHHLRVFSSVYNKYLVIFRDKEIQTQKWCIKEKFRHQKLGVIKVFNILKLVLDFDLTTFWKNDCSTTWFLYSQSKNFHLGQLSNHP